MRTWRECLIEQIADQKSAIAYLQAILEDYQIYKESRSGSKITPNRR